MFPMMAGGNLNTGLIGGLGHVTCKCLLGDTPAEMLKIGRKLQTLQILWNPSTGSPLNQGTI